jgi:alkaline phosphatase
MTQGNSGNVLGLFELERLTRLAPEPTLAELADKAIQKLSENRSGFFLMVEGSEIDIAAHASDAAAVVGQVRNFDAAVSTALAFARKQKRTLVIVTCGSRDRPRYQRPRAGGSP